MELIAQPSAKEHPTNQSTSATAHKRPDCYHINPFKIILFVVYTRRPLLNSSLTSSGNVDVSSEPD